MSNSILTIDMITRKALEILENNLVLTRNVNRQYDDSFAVEGAKIGSTLRIRLPDRALVTDGAALQVRSLDGGHGEGAERQRQSREAEPPVCVHAHLRCLPPKARWLRRVADSQ